MVHHAVSTLTNVFHRAIPKETRQRNHMARIEVGKITPPTVAQHRRANTPTTETMWLRGGATPRFWTPTTVQLTAVQTPLGGGKGGAGGVGGFWEGPWAGRPGSFRLVWLAPSPLSLVPL